MLKDQHALTAFKVHTVASGHVLSSPVDLYASVGTIDSIYREQSFTHALLEHEAGMSKLENSRLCQKRCSVYPPPVWTTR